MFGGDIGLVPADIDCIVQDLPLKVAGFEDIMIDNTDAPDSGSCKLLQKRRSESACSYYENRGRSQLSLPCRSHFWQKNMPRISLQFVVCKI